MAVHCVRNSTDADPYTHANCNANADSYTDSNGDAYADSNGDAYADSNADAYTNTAADVSGRGCSLRGPGNNADR